jgi:hypothetical protein
LLASLLVLVTCTSPADASDADKQCRSTWNKAGQLWAQYGRSLKKAAAQTAAAYGDRDEAAMAKHFNRWESEARKHRSRGSAILKDSPHQVGPRPLSERVRSATTTHQRTWITAGMLNTHRATVRIIGQGGKARGAKITVCTLDSNGDYALIQSRSLTKGDLSRTFGFTVPKPLGKIVSVLVSKTGGAGSNAYKYSISLERSTPREAVAAAGQSAKKGKGRLKRACDGTCKRAGGRTGCAMRCTQCTQACQKKHNGKSKKALRKSCVAMCFDAARHDK